MVENAIADMLLKEFEMDKEVDQSQLKKFGEDLMIDKIKSIFDEVAQEKELFEQRRSNTVNTSV